MSDPIRSMGTATQTFHVPRPQASASVPERCYLLVIEAGSSVRRQRDAGAAPQQVRHVPAQLGVAQLVLRHAQRRCGHRDGLVAG